MKKLLFVLVTLLLPTALFAKGDIIGYAAGWTSQPSAAKLDKVTHVMVFQILPQSNGSLNLEAVPNWLDGFVSTAHGKGVKVSIAVGGWMNNESPQSPSYASAAGANRSTFVNNLTNFVNTHNLDGIDIDWEYPQGTTGWNNFISLCSELKAELPGKRISAALSGETPSNSSFPGNVRSGIWNVLDAIHIMAYDMQNEWPTHADATKAKQLIDAWASWGNGQPGFNKEKLILGTAFYGYNGPWSQVAYKDGGGTGCDSPTSLKTKFDHTWDNGYGGVMIWELSQDDNNLTLLSALYNAKTGKLNGGGGNPQVNNYNISVTYNSGGTVKNGSSTVNSGSSISVQSGNSLTLTIAANSGYSISDVKINGTSNSAAKTSGTYTFSNVTQSQSINVTFAQNGTTPTPPNPPAGAAPDLADGSWGDDAWSRVTDEDEEKNGSTLTITKQGNPLTATWKLGSDPGDEADDDEYPYAGIAFFDGDWSGVTQIEIKYSVNQPTYIALNSKNGHEYYFELEIGNGKSATLTKDSFSKFSWDGGSHSLKMSEVEGISLNAFESYGQLTNLTVTSLIVRGLVIEDDPEPTPPGPSPIAQNKNKTVSNVGVSVMSSKINMSLPASANSANIVLFDVRGRILFERSVAVNANFASVALPKSLLRNQAAILQVKTNSGFNMTKRILIK